MALHAALRAGWMAAGGGVRHGVCASVVRGQESSLEGIRKNCGGVAMRRVRRQGFVQHVPRYKQCQPVGSIKDSAVPAARGASTRGHQHASVTVINTMANADEVASMKTLL